MTSILVTSTKSLIYVGNPLSPVEKAGNIRPSHPLGTRSDTLDSIDCNIKLLLIKHYLIAAAATTIVIVPTRALERPKRGKPQRARHGRRLNKLIRSRAFDSSCSAEALFWPAPTPTTTRSGQKRVHMVVHGNGYPIHVGLGLDTTWRMLSGLINYRAKPSSNKRHDATRWSLSTVGWLVFRGL